MVIDEPSRSLVILSTIMSLCPRINSELLRSSPLVLMNSLAEKDTVTELLGSLIVLFEWRSHERKECVKDKSITRARLLNCQSFSLDAGRAWDCFNFGSSDIDRKIASMILSKTCI